MARSYTAGLALLPLLLLVAVSEAALRNNFKPKPSSFCPAPGEAAQGKAVLPPDFHAACRSRNEAERDKLTRAYEALLVHLEGLMSQSNPVNNELTAFLGATRERMGPALDITNLIDNLRKQTLAAAIGAGRIHESIALYAMSGSWDDIPVIVDRINENPRRQKQHIENLLLFISSLPSRSEQLEFYRHLRNPMIAHKYHESYLGGLFAKLARPVVFGADNKTALNKTDERELWTTMVGASAGHFKRSILAGKNVIDVLLLDRYHYEVLEMLLPTIFNVSKEDLRHLDTAKMIEVPCRVYRAHTRVLLFREIIRLLQQHFTWENQNFIYAPQIAHAYKECKSWFGNGTMATALNTESLELFKRFKQKQTFDTLLKTMQDRLKVSSG